MTAQIKELINYELPVYIPKAIMLNIDLPRKVEIKDLNPKWTYRECPNCTELLAWPTKFLAKNVVLVCDWCEWEWEY